jgi:hypothetical protein
MAGEKEWTRVLSIQMKKILLLLMVAILTFLLWPVERVIAPEWRIELRDPDNKSLSDVRLRQTWQDYTVQKSSSEEDRSSDGSGVVVFPLRTISSSRLGIFWGAVRQGPNVHASYGPHSYIFVVDPRYKDNFVYPGWHGGPERRLESVYRLYYPDLTFSK